MSLHLTKESPINRPKTKIFNLIILDESGSMRSAWKSTISGCNETINVIRSSQQEFADTQEHYVSIFLFQSSSDIPSRYLIKNVPADEVEHITEEQYRPWGSTPLYDAIGSTLVDLKVTVGAEEQAIGNVTIITDGYENSSRQFTREKVASMIDALKEQGWCINFIGANIDVAETAKQFHIDNTMEFDSNEEGTQKMFTELNHCRMRWSERVHNFQSRDEKYDFKLCMKEANRDFFVDEEALAEEEEAKKEKE